MFTENLRETKYSELLARENKNEVLRPDEHTDMRLGANSRDEVLTIVRVFSRCAAGKALRIWKDPRLIIIAKTGNWTNNKVPGKIEI